MGQRRKQGNKNNQRSEEILNDELDKLDEDWAPKEDTQTPKSIMTNIWNLF